MDEMNLFEQFRQAGYGCLRKWADALLDLIDSLTVASQVESPVALSEEIPFRRQHCSIPDALNQGQLDLAALGQVLYGWQPRKQKPSLAMRSTPLTPPWKSAQMRNPG